MKHAALVLFLLFPIMLCAQERYISWTDFADTYFDEQSSEELQEQLEQLYLHPMNLNTVSRDDLLRLPFLDEAQADSILAYRDRHHQFLTLGELQFITGLSYTDRCYLSLFLQAWPLPQQVAPLKVRLLGGRHELEARLDIPLYRRRGEQNGAYLGSGLYNNLRYRYDWHRRVQYGLTLEKDAGEPIGRYRNYPYDALSAYAHYLSPNNRYELLAGDYTVTIGQGLLFGCATYGSKATLLDAPRRTAMVLHNHSSLSEARFFRGVAGGIRHGNWLLTTFLSYRQLDSRQEGDTVRSFLYDGYHRTTRELSRRRNVDNVTAGGQLLYLRPQWRIGVSGLYTHYNHFLHPEYRAYTQYFMRGEDAAGLSVNYYLHSHRITLSGEAAADRRLHLATTNTFVYSPSSSCQLTLQHRVFAPRFVSPHGDALQEGSRVANEHGLLLGGKYNGFHRLELRGYVDFFRFPTSTFRATGASQGFDAMAQALWQLKNGGQLLLRYRTKTKQQNIPKYAGLLQYATTHRLRAQLNLRNDHWELHPAIDIALAGKQTTGNTLGWMLSLRTGFRPTSTLKLAALAAVFFTDDYASACCVYEPYLRHAGGFGACYYHGLRTVLLGQWQLTKNWDIGVKYSLLHYFNKSAIGAGEQLISSASKNDFSLQLRWRF